MRKNMSDSGNHADTADLLAEAKKKIENGNNAAKRSKLELTNIKLDANTLIGRDGIPIKEMNHLSEGVNVSEMSKAEEA